MLWELIKLIVTISLVGGFLFAVKLGLDAFNAAVACAPVRSIPGL